MHRLYVACGFNLKKRPKKRLAPRTPQRLKQPDALNICWSLDYMSDALVSGYSFRTANLLDDGNREGLGIYVAFSLPSQRITRWLDMVAGERGYPQFMRVDNGPENLSKYFKEWANQRGVQLLYIQPGKPAQNAYIERFNRSYREAVLDRYLFKDIKQVQEQSNIWLKHYNEERPHEALENKTPRQFAREVLKEVPTLAMG